MQGKLYGVGIGPGDPDLLTLKAVEVLNNVDYICVPQSGKDRDSLALSIIKEKIKCEGRIIKLTFPMSYQQQVLNKARDKASEKIKKLLNKGNNLAFITLGGPLLYSTYIYILKRLDRSNRAIQVETIPGITSINACTARINIPLAIDNENIAILAEIGDEENFEQILINFENIIVMKLSRNFRKAYKTLDRLDLKENTIIISRCGQDEEMSINNIDELKTSKLDYLSLLITKQEGL